jgi:tripartite-type tricarboxylate transporter receptor subunit TctC
VKERFATLGVQPMPLTPAGFAKFIQDDYDKWSNVIKTTGIKAD